MLKPSISVYGAHTLVPDDKCTVANIVRAAAAVGFDGIDLGYYWGENRAEEIAGIKSVADDCGIAIANYIVGDNLGNAAMDCPAKLQEQMDMVKKALDEAALLGCPALRVFAGGYDCKWEEVSGKIADALAKLAEYAAQTKVIMALEDHGASCKNSAQLLYYLNYVNSPWLRANVDIGNFWNYGELPETGVRNTAKYAAMVHVKDYRRVNGTLLSVPVGEGEIDFTKAFQILTEAGYSGYVTLEYECQIGCPKQGIIQSLAHIRRCATAF